MCTVELSKVIYEVLTLGEMLNISFEHHKAKDDALVAAKIFLDICKINNLKNKIDLYENLNIILGYVKNNKIVKPVIDNICAKKKKIDFVKNNLVEPTELFLNKTVSFTGPLNFMARSRAASIIISLGGTVSSSVNMKTDIIISNLNDKFETSKLKKYFYLLELGKNIKCLNESEFSKMINLFE